MAQSLYNSNLNDLLLNEADVKNIVSQSLPPPETYDVVNSTSVSSLSIVREVFAPDGSQFNGWVVRHFPNIDIFATDDDGASIDVCYSTDNGATLNSIKFYDYTSGEFSKKWNEVFSSRLMDITHGYDSLGNDVYIGTNIISKDGMNWYKFALNDSGTGSNELPAYNKKTGMFALSEANGMGGAKTGAYACKIDNIDDTISNIISTSGAAWCVWKRLSNTTDASFGVTAYDNGFLYGATDLENGTWVKAITLATDISYNSESDTYIPSEIKIIEEINLDDLLLGENPVAKCFHYDNGKLFIAQWSGVTDDRPIGCYDFNAGTWTVVKLNSLSSNGDIKDGSFCDDYFYVVCKKDGIYRTKDGKSYEKLALPSDLPSDFTFKGYSIAVDHEKNLVYIGNNVRTFVFKFSEAPVVNKKTKEYITCKRDYSDRLSEIANISLMSESAEVSTVIENFNKLISCLRYKY